MKLSDYSAKATPVDADSLVLVDSAASNAVKRATWANVKSVLKTYFDSLYPSDTWTVVNSSSATVSPSASDTGKLYRLSNASATLALPTTSLVVGKTHFWVEFTGGAGTIDAGTKSIQYSKLQLSESPYGYGSGEDASIVAPQYQMGMVRYVATDIWAVVGLVPVS